MRRTTLAMLAVLLVGARAGANDWVGFQNGGRTVLPDTGFATEWSADAGLSWQQALNGYGQSTPVVVDGRIFVTYVSGKQKDNVHVDAFDLKTGKPLWQFQDTNHSPEASSNYVSKAAPTPVADANGVVALFEGGNLVALKPSGDVRWKRNLVKDYGAVAARHGLSSSLEQDAEQVYLWMERGQQPYVLAVSKTSGETTWKSDGLGTTSWASPRLVELDGSRQLVLSGIGQLAGIDVTNGKRLWTFDGLAGNSTPTPYSLGGGRLVIGATVGGANGGSGAAKSNGVVQVSAGDESKSFSVDYVWRADGATSSFGSPISDRGLAWFVNRAGVIYCLDAASGKLHFQKRSSGSIWATPIVIGERVYFFGKNGTTTVIQASPEFQQLAVNTLWSAEAPRRGGGPAFGGPVLYGVAAADSHLVLRRGDRLYAVGPTGGESE